MNAGDARSAVFGRLLLWLVAQERAEAATYNAAENALVEHVAREFNRIDDRELESFLKQNTVAGNLAEWQKFVYMPILEDDGRWLPVLTLKYNLADDELRLRVGMFRLIEDPDPQLRGIGYRFETPETGGQLQNEVEGQEPGVHSFHHAQPIKTFDPEAARRALPTPDWLGDQQPSFPLDADNYFQLLIAMLVSIYGRGPLLFHLRSESTIFRMLHPHIREMRCLQGGALLATQN